jgi:large subunit ribosomal protein L29
MAILKMKKIRELGEKDIEDRRKELQMELSKERASSEVGGTVKNPGRIKEIRRTLARIKTHQTQKAAKEETKKEEKNPSVKASDNKTVDKKTKDRGGSK